MNGTHGIEFTDRLVSYEELKLHATYADAWIAINGTVFDITDFISSHPFGDTFTGQLGTECGGLFESAHSMVSGQGMLDRGGAERMGLKIVGVLDISTDIMHRDHEDALLERIIYTDTRRDAFWIDLRKEVVSLIKREREDTHYTTLEGGAIVVYYFLIYAVLSYLAWGHASALAGAILGFHMLCALAHIAHMATHHGFTRVAFLDRLSLTFFDLAGMSGKEWQVAHLTHHSQPHSSLDNQTNRYDYMGVRLHESMPHKWWHRHQWWYFWIVAAGYLPYKFFETTFWIVTQRRNFLSTKDIAVHLVCRVVLLSQIAFCVRVHGLESGIFVVISYSVVFSYCAFVLLFNNHEETHELLGKTEDVAYLHRNVSWAETQVRTSGNWYSTNLILKFIEFHYGYFNYHIEHHLFPTFKPPLLKKISPIVRSVCERHQIPYISTTFFDVQKSFVRHLLRMGKK